MQMLVGLTPQAIDTASTYTDLDEGGQTVVVQNLGPGDIYLDPFPSMDATSGMKIGVGGAYEYRQGKQQQTVYVVASVVDTDVRVVVVG